MQAIEGYDVKIFTGHIEENALDGYGRRYLLPYISPLHSRLHNAWLGVVVGGMLPGRRLIIAMQDVIKSSNEWCKALFDD